MTPINIRTSIPISIISLILVAIPGGAFAASSEEPELACPGPSLAPRKDAVPDRENSPILVWTRQFEARKTGIAEAREDVELRRADQLLTTELLQYDPQAEIVTIPGKMFYEDSIMHISGSSAHYNFLDESGRFEAVDYGLVGSSAKGSATDIAVSSGNHGMLHGLQFTTCPGDSPEWLLNAKELELEFDKGMGKVKGATLRFFDIPFIYLPYMTFPIDDRRKSGFLYPFISTANDNGFEFSIPYYWNIAPNHDATLTPRYFTERGGMLTAEYRFMTQRTGGEIDVDYMPNDSKTDESRYHYSINHSAFFNPRWRSAILIDKVSDEEYFQDFSNSLAGASRQYLRSSVGLYGAGRYWHLSVIADDFQVLDDIITVFNEPYQRLPRISFNVDRPLGNKGLRVAFDSELVYFDREFAVGVTGSRLDILPRLEWNLDTSWGYVRPTLGYRYTTYNLDRNGLPGETSPSRGTEIVSFDTGMFFERDNGTERVQTLEPRLFYLYVPYVDQEEFPDFDSAPFTFGFSQLFHYNRFTGADRQSDANQITLALTTRSIDRVAGRELWSLSFGQIIHFDPQRVESPDFEPPRDKNASPFIGEFIFHLTKRLSSRVNAQWNWETKKIDVAVLGAIWSGRNGLRLGAEYRYRRGSLDQFDIRYYQPVSENWRVLGRVNYSLLDSDLLAAEAGFEYDSCCWALRTVAKRFLRNREGDHRDALYVQLILKGLGNIGRRSTPLFYDMAY